MQKPLISIIVPVFNVEKYLSKCIDSLIKQTYVNKEIILIDDGSTDHCGEICDNYHDKFPNLIKVIHKINGGLSSARNLGIANANGLYIIFVDSDDYIEANMIEVLFHNIMRTNVDICVSSFYEEYENNTKNVDLDDDILTNIEALKFLTKEDKGYAMIVMWNKLINRDVLNGISFPEGKIHEDQWIIHKLLYKSKKISLISDRLYHHVNRPNSISTKSIINHFDDIDALFDRIDFYKKHSLDNLLPNLEQQMFNLAQFYLYSSSNYGKFTSEEIKFIKKQFNKCYKFSKECYISRIISKKKFSFRKKFYKINFMLKLKLKYLHRLKNSKHYCFYKKIFSLIIKREKKNETRSN